MTLLERSHPDFVERVAPDFVRPLDLVERDAIESAMILCGGNLSEAANRLGISRATLHRKLSHYRRADA